MMANPRMTKMAITPEVAIWIFLWLMIALGLFFYHRWVRIIALIISVLLIVVSIPTVIVLLGFAFLVLTGESPWYSLVFVGIIFYYIIPYIITFIILIHKDARLIFEHKGNNPGTHTNFHHE
jgi:hypothetical protein